jgi:hypothetical protein
MKKKDVNVKLIQKRVANISIGQSTLRNQGPQGTITIARRFLSKLDLRQFKNLSENQFERRINTFTSKLMKQFPKASRKNWGAARKAINVFLEQAFYDRFLTKAYKLDKLENVLELPLDRDVTRGLREHAEQGNLPRWKGIKNLTPEDSQEFQEFAKRLAKKKGISRIYLDLAFWRAKVSERVKLMRLLQKGRI